MHVLAFVNQKGGCGKTTTAVNLAGALAAKGERVLLVDLDPQAHATLGVGVALQGEPSLLEVLYHGVPAEQALRDAAGGFRILPASRSLAEFEETAVQGIQPERALTEALADVREDFSFALLDCPPRVDGVLTANALHAAHTVVLVVECGAYALQGAIQALDVLDEAAGILDRGFELRMLATLFDARTRLARELLIGMQSRFGNLLFDTVVRTSVRLREAAAYGAPVQVIDPRGRAAQDFSQLAEEVRALARTATPGPRPGPIVRGRALLPASDSR